MAFVAFLDANVLFPAVLRDVLLSLAEAGVYQIRWSPDILDEMERNLVKKARAQSRTAATGGVRYLRETMELAFPDAMVIKEAYQPLISVMPVNEKDRHVLAAAIVGRADVLVTLNISHFPLEACNIYGIDVQTPDTFLVHQFGLVPGNFIRVLTDLSHERKPPMDTPKKILSALQLHAPSFCEMALAKLREETNT